MKKGGGQPGCPAVVLKLWPMSLGGLVRTQITRPHSQISDSVGLGWGQGDADDTSLRTVPLRTSYKGLRQIGLLFPILQFLLRMTYLLLLPCDLPPPVRGGGVYSLPTWGLATQLAWA